MLDKEEKQLLVDVSILYYLEDKTQSQIAKELFISRSKVSRLLKKARQHQIVDISINYQSEELEKIQNAIKRRFNIEKVIVTKTLTNAEDTLREIGKAAAKQLDKEIESGMTIGVSMGKNIRMAANYMKPKQINDLKIVELFGAISSDKDSEDIFNVGRTFSEKLTGKLYELLAPIYIEDDSAVQIIRNTPVIRNTLEMIDNCDLIITGIGSIYSSGMQVIWDSYVDKKMKRFIIEEGGVGFFCAHFFDENGKFLDNYVNHNIIGISTKKITEKRSLVIGACVEKAKAIYAALKGGIIDVLISDEETLKQVLTYYERDNKRLMRKKELEYEV